MNYKLVIILMIGKILGGRYQIIRLLGEGGFAKTFIAEDKQRPSRPQCVVKQLKLNTNNPNFLTIARRLFNQEATILEKLSQANQNFIPQLLAYFEEDRQFYLVEEFIDGYPLSQEIKLSEQWQEIRVKELLQEVLTILKFVHSHNVIHRDIKPDNIIRRKSDGKLVLIDFGAVKEISQQQLHNSQLINQTISVGTLGYMPPEQISGNPRLSSDIYALGMIAITALTAIEPSQLQQDEDGEIIWKKYANCSPSLENFLDKMVRHYFKFRYQNAHEALEDLMGLFSSNDSQAKTVFLAPNASEINNVNTLKVPTKKRKLLGLFLTIAAIFSAIFGALIANKIEQFDRKQSLPNSSPLSKISAEKAVINYYQTINRGQLNNSWQQLNNNFRQKYSNNSYQSYINWWNKVKSIEIEQVRLLQSDGKNARVDIKLKYYMKSKKIAYDHQQIFLEWDNNKNLWMFVEREKIKN